MLSPRKTIRLTPGRNSSAACDGDAQSERKTARRAGRKRMLSIQRRLGVERKRAPINKALGARAPQFRGKTPRSRFFTVGARFLLVRGTATVEAEQLRGVHRREFLRRTQFTGDGARTALGDLDRVRCFTQLFLHLVERLAKLAKLRLHRAQDFPHLT